MRRIGLVAAVCVGIAGCSRDDPETSFLPPGTTAVITSKVGGANLDKPDHPSYRTLAPGVRVLVGHDPGPTGDPIPDKFRLVEITVESGESKDFSGATCRIFLRSLR